MSEHPAPSAEFLALRAECEALGYLWGMDFFIWYIPAALSSEYIMLGLVDEDYAVTYSDMGHDTLLFRSADFAPARERFLEELTWLAAGRNRGPNAGRKSPWKIAAEKRTTAEGSASFYHEYGRGTPHTEA